MAAPTAAISGNNVRISWLKPTEYGATITSYAIVVKDSAVVGTTYHVMTPSYCDGTQAAILTALACEVPLSVLIASPFNLAFDALVVAKVTASNSNGAGTQSAANTAGA